MPIAYNSTEPYYRQIADDIRLQIRVGELAVGDRIGSQRELAEQYQVSAITVKKAVQELIQDGFLTAHVGRGTFVARTEAPVDHTAHRSIGLVLEELDVPFFSEVVQDLEGLAYDEGYNLVLSLSAGRREKEEGQIRHFREIGVDGLVIAAMDRRHRLPTAVRELHEARFPYVMVSYVEDPEAYFVGVDNRTGAERATTHLFETGRQRVAYLGDQPGNALGELRRAGYRDAVERSGRPFETSLVFDVLTGTGWKRQDAAYHFGKTLLERGTLPDAVFCYNDLSALGLMRALLEAGVSVPDDVALVGFDDIRSVRHAPVPLTTIRQPTERIAEAAMQMLRNQIDQIPGENRSMLDPELVVRASTGVVSTVERG